MFGVLYHPKIERSKPLAEAICAWLHERGHHAWQESVWDETAFQSNVDGITLLIVLGGDGSVLRAARAAAPHGVPIFSVNLGRLGFLTEATVDDWPDRLDAFLHDRHRLERRLMLRVSVEREGQLLHRVSALNEAVVGRGRQARVLRFKLFVDGDHVASYVADGVILATPTGSTAYALAAGGPIMPPELPNFVVVPVAPHLVLDRSIVLYEKSVAQLSVYFDHEASVSVDGRESFPLEDGDCVTICRAEHESLFVRVDDPSYFYKRLMDRSGGVLREW